MPAYDPDEPPLGALEDYQYVLWLDGARMGGGDEKMMECLAEVYRAKGRDARVSREVYPLYQRRKDTRKAKEQRRT